MSSSKSTRACALCIGPKLANARACKRLAGRLEQFRRGSINELARDFLFASRRLEPPLASCSSSRADERETAQSWWAPCCEPTGWRRRLATEFIGVSIGPCLQASRPSSERVGRTSRAASTPRPWRLIETSDGQSAASSRAHWRQDANNKWRNYITRRSGVERAEAAGRSV